MKGSSFAIAVMLVLALAGCAGPYATPPGWTSLVNGPLGIDNWDRIGDANWRVEEGAIVADNGKGGFLVSPATYKDFDLVAEFWAATDTNSGIFMRCGDRTRIGAATCYEVNIWDIRPEPKYGTGAIVDHAAVPVPLTNKAGGKWNTYEITVKGSQLIVKLNGVQTVNIQDTKHAAGVIALQYGAGVRGAQGGAIKWRKVNIRPL